MINEISHIKLGFAELERNESSDSCLHYCFNSADTAWIVFALEERDEHPPVWKQIHASWMLGEESMYGTYKKGAAWEVHTGQRRFRGQRLKVEKYLAELAKLPITELSEIGPLRPMAKKSVNEHAMQNIVEDCGHKWDKSSWDMSSAGEAGPFVIPLTTRSNLVFLQRISGPCEVYLESQSGAVTGTIPQTMELFA